MFGVVSLTMGNSVFPFAHRLEGDAEVLGEHLLGDIFTFAEGFYLFPDFYAHFYFLRFVY